MKYLTFKPQLHLFSCFISAGMDSQTAMAVQSLLDSQESTGDASQGKKSGSKFKTNVILLICYQNLNA